MEFINDNQQTRHGFFAEFVSIICQAFAKACREQFLATAALFLHPINELEGMLFSSICRNIFDVRRCVLRIAQKFDGLIISKPNLNVIRRIVDNDFIDDRME